MIADVETLLVAWAKASPALTALNGSRVATRLPREPWTTFVRVNLVAALPSYEADQTNASVQFDVFATNAAQSAPAFPQASLIARTLAEELRSIRGAEVTGGYLYDATVTDLRPLDDPELTWARYTVSAVVAYR